MSDEVTITITTTCGVETCDGCKWKEKFQWDYTGGIGRRCLLFSQVLLHNNRCPQCLSEYGKGKAATEERKYPCDNCGKARTKDEGGTVFTVCDECWDKLHGKGKKE